MLLHPPFSLAVYSCPPFFFSISPLLSRGSDILSPPCHTSNLSYVALLLSGNLISSCSSLNSWLGRVINPPQISYASCDATAPPDTVVVQFYEDEGNPQLDNPTARQTSMQERTFLHHGTSGEFSSSSVQAGGGSTGANGNSSSMRGGDRLHEVLELLDRQEQVPELHHKALQAADVPAAPPIRIGWEKEEEEDKFEGGKWYAGYSIGGKDGEGLDKQNQDSFLLSPFLGGDLGVSLFGIFDGHGRQGHLVSSFAKKVLPSLVGSKLEQLMPGRRKDGSDRVKEGDGGSSGQGIPQLLSETCSELQRLLLEQTDFDVMASGSTAVIALIVDDLLFVANVGDSRAILAHAVENQSGRKEERERLAIVAMSTDQTPGLSCACERERERQGRREGGERADREPWGSRLQR